MTWSRPVTTGDTPSVRAGTVEILCARYKDCNKRIVSSSWCYIRRSHDDGCWNETVCLWWRKRLSLLKWLVYLRHWFVMLSSWFCRSVLCVHCITTRNDDLVESLCNRNQPCCTIEAYWYVFELNDFVSNINVFLLYSDSCWNEIVRDWGWWW